MLNQKDLPVMSRYLGSYYLHQKYLSRLCICRRHSEGVNYTDGY